MHSAITRERERERECVCVCACEKESTVCTPTHLTPPTPSHRHTVTLSQPNVRTHPRRHTDACASVIQRRALPEMMSGRLIFLGCLAVSVHACVCVCVVRVCVCHVVRVRLLPTDTWTQTSCPNTKSLPPRSAPRARAPNAVAY